MEINRELITSRGRAQLAEERTPIAASRWAWNRQWQAVDATLRGIWPVLSLSVPFNPLAPAAPLQQGA